MGQLQLQHIPLAELHVSKLNMRHGRKKPDISDILPSIRKTGIRQTLLVREERGGYGVVAGRRRYFALKQIAKETGKAIKVPCAIMAADDDAAALEATLIENIGRVPAGEVSQYRCFKSIHDQGRSPADIAEHFGVTELSVRRVLALAGLDPDVLKLYEHEDLDRETVKALTLASAEQQADWLSLYHDPDQRAPMGRQCKAWVTGGTAITTDKALFDLESYDGEVIADLFGDNGVFASTEVFWEHQSKAVSDQIEALLQKGWPNVRVLERGTYFAEWEHEKRARSKGGIVIVEIRHDGQVKFHEGYVTRAEARKLDRAETDSDTGDANSKKPELSGPLAEYVSLHRHGAARASLLKLPDIALRLMLAHTMVGSPLWQVHPHRHVSRKHCTEASIETSRAGAEMSEAQAHVADLLEAHGINPSLPRNGDEYRLCQLFVAFLGMDDQEVLTILAFIMADTLGYGGAVVEAVLVACETPLADYWKPDQALFELLRDKKLVNAMLADIGGDTLAATMLTDTAKVQKQAISNRIIGEGCEAQPDWRPAFMSLPPRRYLNGGASRPADGWAKIEPLFTSNVAEAGTATETQDAA